MQIYNNYAETQNSGWKGYKKAKPRGLSGF